MNVADKRYFERWLNDLGDLNPEKLWRELVASNKLPAIDLFNAVSAVYSANIEGNPIDVNSYLASKFRGGKFKFRARDRKEIENLESAYRFAQTHALNEKNFLVAHEMLAATLLRKSSLVKYRDQVVYVYSRAGLEYVALEPEHVPEAMQNMFAEVRKLRRASLRITEAFYHAALIHLVFVHIHAFMDGNGRAARLLEKWFLASKLGRQAWHVASEGYYKENVAAYYRNIKLGLSFYTLDYDRCVPFLVMLVESVAA